MLDVLFDPFTYPFMQKAMFMALLIAPASALISCFLVLKGWALMGDAVSHAILPGIVAAYLLGLPLIIGAFAAGMGAAVLTGWLAENSRIKRDTLMGVVFSGMFALGIVAHVASGSGLHLDHILFGNILGVGTADLWTGGVIGLTVALAIILKWKDLMLMAFDPAQARASGLHTGWLHYGLLAGLSLTVVAVLSSVGLILAVGLLIAPGAIAFLLTRRFSRMLALSVVICTGSMLSGIWLSFHLDSAPGPTIILILSALFAFALAARLIATKRASQIV